MIEKITVDIKLTKFGRETKLGHQIDFLQRAFEISNKRAHSLAQKLSGSFDNSLIVDLNYRQLARYTALRVIQRNKQNDYAWGYPRIIDFVEAEEPPQADKPIELRPGLRTVEKSSTEQNLEKDQDDLKSDAFRWRYFIAKVIAFNLNSNAQFENSEERQSELNKFIDAGIKDNG